MCTEILIKSFVAFYYEFKSRLSLEAKCFTDKNIHEENILKKMNEFRYLKT